MADAVLAPLQAVGAAASTPHVAAEAASTGISLARAASPQPRTLSVEAIHKSFGKRKILQGLSLHVGAGEVVGLLGRDGAGKTLCFNLIMGFVQVDSGAILLGDTDVTRWPADRRARLGLSYLPQDPSIFRDMTVEQNIRTVLELNERHADAVGAKLDQLLRGFQLEHLRQLPAIRLSGGERRRCEIARSLACDPSIMLLDEPFAGIDPLAIIDIKRAIATLKSRNVGVLVSDQNLRDMIGLLDRAYVVHEGRVIFAGAPARMTSDPEVRRLYLGPEFDDEPGRRRWSG